MVNYHMIIKFLPHYPTKLYIWIYRYIHDLIPKQHLILDKTQNILVISKNLNFKVAKISEIS